jgi:hypothetical protein
VVRSDASEAHRLSLSARVLSVELGQVKAKRPKKRPWPAAKTALTAVANRSPAGEPDRQGTGQNSVFYPGNTGIAPLKDRRPRAKRNSAPLAVRHPGTWPLILVIVVLGLIGAVRLAALIVPELSVHAVFRQELPVRTALDRLAP